MFKKMVCFFILSISLVSSGWAETTGLSDFSAVSKPAKEFFIGEKLIYSIRYFGIPIGRAEGWVKEVVPVRGRPAYHIVVKVASTSVVDLIYKVRGEHHTYLDVKTLYSLRYQAQYADHPNETAFEMSLDHEKKQADYFYPKRNIQKKFPMESGSQDRLSLGYFFRTIEVQPESSVIIPLHTEQKQWHTTIQTLKTRKMNLSKVGSFEALEIIPQLGFVSSLQKKGRIRAWISLDERRIPLQLSARAPLFGSVKVSLVSYTPGVSYRKQ